MNNIGQIEDYLTKLKSDPNNLEILNKIAKFHFENQDFDKALEICIKISKINPTNSNSFNNRCSSSLTYILLTPKLPSNPVNVLIVLKLFCILCVGKNSRGNAHSHQFLKQQLASIWHVHLRESYVTICTRG